MATKPKAIKTAAIVQDREKGPAASIAKKQRPAPQSVAVPKTAAPKMASVKPTPVKPAIATPQVVVRAAKAATADAGALKKKDLIERVIATTGAKKNQVREIVEATLTVLGDALSKGTMLNLPPFGKAKVSRPSDVMSGKAMTVKLRRGQAAGKGAVKDRPSLADEQD